MLRVYSYDKCGTCRNAIKWLTANGIAFELIPIVTNPPDVQELAEWIPRSEKPIGKWFNTSGEKYRELGMKDRMATMTEVQKIELLASEGKLIKRPIISDGVRVTVGFDVSEFERVWVGGVT